MDDTFFITLVNTLQRHEGFRAYPYEDTTGHLTVGYGHVLSNGISPQAAYVILKEDVLETVLQLDSLKPMWKDLPREARLIIANMAFNVGVQSLLGFRKMWAALEVGNYPEAAKEMRDSIWFVQVRGRGKELADKMERVTEGSQTV